MLRFKILFIDQESEGDVCTGCKKEIEGKKWVMVLDFDDPVNFPPAPLNVIFCTICKEKADDKSK